MAELKRLHCMKCQRHLAVPPKRLSRSQISEICCFGVKLRRGMVLFHRRYLNIKKFRCFSGEKRHLAFGETGLESHPHKPRFTTLRAAGREVIVVDKYKVSKEMLWIFEGYVAKGQPKAAQPSIYQSLSLKAVRVLWR